MIGKKSLIVLFLCVFLFSFVSAVTVISNTDNSTFTGNIDASSHNIWAAKLYGNIANPTGNTTEQIQDATGSMANGTLIYDDANNVLYVNVSAIPFTETDSLAYNGTLALNSTFSLYIPLETLLSFGYYNTTNFPYNNNLNFTNGRGFITNATMNKTVSCTDIIGSPDTDFCTDAVGGGSGASDQDLNTTSNVTFNSLVSKTFINATDWSNVSITESQISDLTHTVDTNETTRFNALANFDCPSGQLVIGVRTNGTVLCATDTTGGGGNTTEEMQDAVFAALDANFTYNDTANSVTPNETSFVAWLSNTFWDAIGDVPTATPSNGDTTHLSTADQIFDYIAGLNYVANAVTWAQVTNGTMQTALTNEAGLYAALSDVTEFIETGDAATLATLDTGQGANELYDMNQNVLTSSNVQFVNLTINSLNASSGSWIAGRYHYGGGSVSCDLTINHSVCWNNTGTYTVG